MGNVDIRWLWAALAASLVAFLPAISSGFVFDDWLWLNLAADPAAGSGLDPASPIFRPGLVAWFAGLSALGTSPVLFHLAGWVVLAVVAFEVAAVACRIGLDTRRAAAAGAIVALHPVWATPIGWSAAASSLLAVAFGLGAVLAVTSDRTWGPWAAALLVVVAVTTRETAVAFAMIVPAVAAVRWPVRRAAVRAAPAVVTVVGYTLFRMMAGAAETSGTYAVGVGGHIVDNLQTIGMAAIGMAGRMDRHLGAGTVGLLAVAVLTLLVLAADPARVRTKTFAAAVVWVAASVAPVVVLANQPMSPHYADVAVPGVALGVAAAVRTSRWWKTAAPVLAVLAAVLVHASVVTSPLERHRAVNEQQIVAVSAAYPDGPQDGRVVVKGCHLEQHLARDGDLFRVMYSDPDLAVAWVC